MAGEIQLNGTTLATESSGDITLSDSVAGVCRAWVQINGASSSPHTKTAEYGNVGAITSTTSGTFTFNFDTTVSVGYAVLISASDQNGGSQAQICSTNGTLGTTSFSFKTFTYAGALVDPDEIFVAVFY